MALIRGIRLTVANDMLKQILHAPAVYDTWAKHGVRYASDELDIFVTKFLWYNKSVYTATIFNRATSPDRIGWGKGVGNAFQDYQWFDVQHEEEVELSIDQLMRELANYVGGRSFESVGSGDTIKVPMSLEQVRRQLGVGV